MKNIKIKGGYVAVKLDNIHEHLQAINQGKGVTKTKKGKGSYNRKEKHKNRRYDSNDTSCFYAFL